MRVLVISPHNDDAVLFAAFTCIEHSAQVLTVFDSYKQGENFALRRREDEDAMRELGCPPPMFLGYRDDRPQEDYESTLAFDIASKIGQGNYELVLAPKVEEGGHWHHNLVATIVDRDSKERSRWNKPAFRFYLTYTKAGKSTNGIAVQPRSADDIIRKWKALACYRSQIQRADNQAHFLRSQEEFLV